MNGGTVDWEALASSLGRIERTANGWTESGGSDAARDALEQIIGPETLRASVDHYIAGGPGSELVRSVLILLRSTSAMARCHQAYLAATDVEERRAAIELLRSIGDKRILGWAPTYLADPDPQVQVWAIGIPDQLLMANLVDFKECEAVLEMAASHANENVRQKAQWIRDHLTN